RRPRPRSRHCGACFLLPRGHDRKLQPRALDIPRGNQLTRLVSPPNGGEANLQICILHKSDQGETMKKLAAILLAFSVLLSLSACGQAGGQAAPTESPVLTTAEPTPSAVINGEMPDDEYDRAIWYGFIDPELASDGDR